VTGAFAAGAFSTGAFAAAGLVMGLAAGPEEIGALAGDFDGAGTVLVEALAAAGVAFFAVALPVLAGADDFCDALDLDDPAEGGVFVIDFVAGAAFLGAATDGFATVNPCAQGNVSPHCLDWGSHIWSAEARMRGGADYQ
jgi:hypothetical protein